MTRPSFPALLAACATVAALALGAGPAGAAPPSAGTSLKASGDALMREKRYPEALAAYDAAARELSDPVLHYNRARALQFLARYPEALAAFQRFQAEAPPAVLAKVPALPELVADVRAKVARFGLRCPVAGARVLLDHREIGRTPFAAPVAVNAGHATLEVLAEGHRPFALEVDLPGGEALTEIDARPQAESTIGVLAVKSRVSGAAAAVDGRPIGATPAEAPLPAGSHTVTTTREGWGPVSTHVVIVAGERKELVLDPIEPTPVYRRWWLWTIVGAAVAGGVVTAVALKTERPPPTGTFSPGQVRF